MHYNRLGLENCKLKATARKQAEKIEQLKENLLREILVSYSLISCNTEKKILFL